VSGVGKEDKSPKYQDEEEEVGDGEGASARPSTKDSQYDSDCKSSQSGSFKHDVLERPKIARNRRRPTSFKTLAITALAASKDGSWSSVTTASVMAGRSSSFVARPGRDGAQPLQKSKLSRPANTFALRGSTSSRDESGDESAHASDDSGDKAHRRSEAWKSDEEKDYEGLGHADKGFESKGQALKGYGAQQSAAATRESDSELSDGDEDDEDDHDLVRRRDKEYDGLDDDDDHETHGVDDDESDSSDDDDVGHAGKSVTKSRDEDDDSDDSLTDDEDLI